MSTRFFYLDGKYVKAFIALVIFSLIYILPIIIANFYYIDDLGRSLSGYTGWNNNGRPLLSAISIILSDGKPLMDISPWIQIASIVVFSYSLILYVRKYVVEASAFQIFCVSVCGYLNLFLLENFSYKYDSLGMILSLSLYFILFSLPDTLNKRKIFLISIVIVFLSSSLYQAAIGAYLSLVFLEVVWLLYNKDTWRIITRRILTRIVGILGGSIIYKMTVVKLMVKGNYSVDHAGILNLFSIQGIHKALTNSTGFALLFKSYGLTMGILGVLLALVLFIGVIYVAYVIWHKREECILLKILSIGFVLITPVFLIVASVLSLIILASPVIAPRVMLSFTVFTLFIGFMLYHLSKMKKGFLIVGVLSAACTLSFSSYYGNLLTRQEQMNRLVAYTIIHDLNEMEVKYGRHFDAISFIGRSPNSHELSLAIKKKPLFGRLVPIYMNNDWYWGGQYLSHYRKKPTHLKTDSDDKLYAESHTAERGNEFYKMYVHDDKVIITF